MKLPKMSYSGERLSLVTDAFGGLNRGEGVAEYEFTDMENISADKYPAMSVRGARRAINTYEDISAMCAADKLAFVSDGRLYYNGARVSGLTLSSGEKTLVSAGSRIYIFPDKKWYDTESASAGSMERSYTLTSGIILFTPALKAFPDASIYQSDTEPEIESPGDFEGKFWLDSASVPCKLKRYIFDGSTGSFVEVTPDCVRLVAVDISGNSIDAVFEGFEAGDGVTLSGTGQMKSVLASQGLDSTFVVLKNGYTEDSMRYMILDTTVTGHRGQLLTGGQTTGSFTITRSVPKLDGAIFCANRIWGYSNADNKIYCSRKNSFNAWYGSSFSLDDPASFDAGSPGDFSACAALGDTPCFFKEGYLHKFIGISQTLIPCRGIRAEDSKSLCVLGDRLVFKSGSDVLSYNANAFTKISEKPGALIGRCEGAVTFGDKYYLSIADGDTRRIFVYNAQRKLWHIESALAFTCGASLGGALYVGTAEGVWQLSEQGESSDAEESISWFAESGDFKVISGERKALSRLVIRCRMEEGSSLNVYVMYDGDGNYIFVGRGRQGLNCIPILPRRCDKLKIRLEGQGPFTLTSLVRVYTKASCL